ncbi:MAG: hypothetical protein AAFW87_02165 [Pseudomonadota bacterium]
MPDDALFDFKFNDTIPNDADDRLAEEIFSLQTMHKVSVEETFARTAKVESAKEPDWDGNVPPDFSDDFDFLL